MTIYQENYFPIIFRNGDKEEKKELFTYLTCEDIANSFNISYQEINQSHTDLSVANYKGMGKKHQYINSLIDKSVIAFDNGESICCDILLYLKNQSIWLTQQLQKISTSFLSKWTKDRSLVFSQKNKSLVISNHSSNTNKLANNKKIDSKNLQIINHYYNYTN